MATVTFFSNYTEHVLTRRPQIDVPLAQGGWQTTQPPVRYRFSPAVNEKGELVGRLDVKVGQDKFKDHSGWLAAGQDQTVDRDAADAMRAYHAFGRDVWESGHAPGTLYPRAQDFRKELLRAVGGLNEERLVEMVSEERWSHARPDLVSEAETALATVREAVAEIAAQQAAQEAAKPAAKAKAKAPVT